METMLREKEGFICDMDGVIYHGNKILPGVREFVEWLLRENKNFLFLTNSSQYTPKELQQKLERMGWRSINLTFTRVRLRPRIS